MDIPAPPGTKVSPEDWALLTDDNDPDNPLSELIAHIRINELWDAHRDYIVAEWVARRPGTRPNRWWLTDEDGKPRLRQQVGGMQYVAYDSWCGAPRIVSGRPVSNETAVFESQAATCCETAFCIWENWSASRRQISCRLSSQSPMRASLVSTKLRGVPGPDSPH